MLNLIAKGLAAIMTTYRRMRVTLEKRGQDDLAEECHVAQQELTLLDPATSWFVVTWSYGLLSGYGSRMAERSRYCVSR